MPSLKKNFDIGIAGPLVGFISALAVLIYGLTHLPPADFIFTIHPEYMRVGTDYASVVYSAEFLKGGLDIRLGDNLLFNALSSVFADPALMPNPHEIIHYPFLLAGYLSLVFTALNLLPIGQLDGGHVVYGLFGWKGHRWVAITVFVVLGMLQFQGAIYSKAAERMIGTIIGLGAGLLLLWLNQHYLHNNGLYFILIGLLSALAGWAAAQGVELA